jgi:hypothetical protein
MHKMTFSGIVLSIALTTAVVLGVYTVVRLFDLARLQMDYLNCMGQLRALELDTVVTSWHVNNRLLLSGFDAWRANEYQSIYQLCNLCRQRVSAWRVFP